MEVTANAPLADEYPTLLRKNGIEYSIRSIVPKQRLKLLFLTVGFTNKIAQLKNVKDRGAPAGNEKA